jgi:hypothetical protein
MPTPVLLQEEMQQTSLSWWQSKLTMGHQWEVSFWVVKGHEVGRLLFLLFYNMGGSCTCVFAKDFPSQTCFALIIR